MSASPHLSLWDRGDIFNKHCNHPDACYHEALILSAHANLETSSVLKWDRYGIVHLFHCPPSTPPLPIIMAVSLREDILQITSTRETDVSVFYASD